MDQCPGRHNRATSYLVQLKGPTFGGDLLATEAAVLRVMDYRGRVVEGQDFGDPSSYTACTNFVQSVQGIAVLHTARFWTRVLRF